MSLFCHQDKFSMESLAPQSSAVNGCRLIKKSQQYTNYPHTSSPSIIVLECKKWHVCKKSSWCFWSGRNRGFPSNGCSHSSAPLTNVALSGNYMQDAMKMKSKIQCYKNTSTAFWFWNMQCLYLFQEVKAFWKTYLRRSVLTLLQIDQCMGNTEIHHLMFLTSHRCFQSSMHNMAFSSENELWSSVWNTDPSNSFRRM